MAGKFEAFVDSDAYFRFRLLAPDGAVVAVSGPYEDKHALAAGIATVRECAGTGLVTDLCPAGVAVRQTPADMQDRLHVQGHVPAQGPADCDAPRIPAGGHTFVLAKGPRRQGSRPRWSAAAAR